MMHVRSMCVVDRPAPHLAKGPPVNIRPVLTTLCLVGLVGLPSYAQTRSEKVDKLASMLTGAINDKQADNSEVYTDAKTGQVIRATPLQLMRETMTSVNLEDIPGKLALEIWASQTNVPLVVNWASLEAQGVDPTTPITLKLHRVPGEQVLKLIIQQLHPDPLGDDELLLDVQQWYVRVMTRQDALRRSTTKMYFIGDLLMDIPHFDNAPGFDLNDALSNTSSGGSNGGGGGGEESKLFRDDNDDRKEKPLSKQEKAQRIVEMIRETIEPDIWRANGGEYGSVRYYRGMLVVKAPAFVHEQIGGTTGSTTKRSSTKHQTKRSSSDSSPEQTKRSSSGNVAGVGSKSPTLVR